VAGVLRFATGRSGQVWGVTQAVELLLDPAAEARVLEQWRLLEEARLASQSRHTGSSNRPHVTLAAVPSLEDGAEARIAESLAGLPLPATLGPVALFGRDPVVLVRLVVADAALLELHAQVALAAGAAADDRQAPGRWVPHVTLAHRMPRAQLLAALEILPDDDVPVLLDRARRWDSTERRAWVVEASPPHAGPDTP
jgi:2'-5' RNA ligase